MKLKLLNKGFILALLFGNNVFAAEYNSVFDIINDVNINSDVEKGNFYNYAKLKVIDKKLGKVEVLNLKVDESVQHNEISINLISCWLEKANKYRTDSRAMIEFIETKDGIKSNAFSGWIFSLNPGISRYNNENYEFILDSCNKSESQTV